MAIMPEITNVVGGADVTEPFFYLAGPMSNMPGFNFDAFNEAARVLRDNGYNIMNPAELDWEIARAAKGNSTGSHKQLTAELAQQGLSAPTWAECLKRDIEILSMDECKGVILLDGWEHSQGAQFETYVAYKYLKPLYVLTFEESLYAALKRDSAARGYGRRTVQISGRGHGPSVTPTLTQIDRREALDAAGVRD